jgi:hypothetical protein
MIEFVLRISVARNLIYSHAMALEMKTRCEKCGANLLPSDEAYICTFECTFCPNCAERLKKICPNRGGELVRRPRKKL